VKFTGPSSSSFPAACVFAGDVNKDGYADVLFGAPDLSTQTGVAYLVLGGPLTTSPYSVTAAPELLPIHQKSLVNNLDFLFQVLVM
jgi:hypothetical protein